MTRLTPSEQNQNLTRCFTLASAQMRHTHSGGDVSAEATRLLFPDLSGLTRVSISCPDQGALRERGPVNVKTMFHTRPKSDPTGEVPDGCVC